MEQRSSTRGQSWNICEEERETGEEEISMFHWREIKIAVNVIILKLVLGTGRCDRSPLSGASTVAFTVLGRIHLECTEGPYINLILNQLPHSLSRCGGGISHSNSQHSYAKKAGKTFF